MEFYLLLQQEIRKLWSCNRMKTLRHSSSETPQQAAMVYRFAEFAWVKITKPWTRCSHPASVLELWSTYISIAFKNGSLVRNKQRKHRILRHTTGRVWTVNCAKPHFLIISDQATSPYFSESFSMNFHKQIQVKISNTWYLRAFPIILARSYMWSILPPLKRSEWVEVMMLMFESLIYPCREYMPWSRNLQKDTFTLKTTIQSLELWLSLNIHFCWVSTKATFFKLEGLKLKLP